MRYLFDDPDEAVKAEIEEQGMTEAGVKTEGLFDA